VEQQADCMPVLIGATPEGKKELAGFEIGVRESAQSRRELPLDLKARGLTVAPEPGTGDGDPAPWKAHDDLSPATRHQCCRVHKTANVFDRLSKSVQPTVKADLPGILQALDRATAETAIATFAGKYPAKYGKVGPKSTEVSDSSTASRSSSRQDRPPPDQAVTRFPAWLLFLLTVYNVFSCTAAMWQKTTVNGGDELCRMTAARGRTGIAPM